MFQRMALFFAILAVSGCAAVQLPAESLQRGEASIRGAQEVGAQSVPQARLHLQYAIDQTETAKRMAANGNERAVLVLARAESDSELAISLARESAMHADAVAAAEDLKAVHARGDR